MNILKTFVFIGGSLLVLSSCNKLNTKKIKIDDKINGKSITNITEIKLEGVPESDYVLFGGDYEIYTKEKRSNVDAVNYSVKHPFPHLVENSNSIFLRPLVNYDNEFYVLSRKLKKDITSIIEHDDKKQRNYDFKKGNIITFVWATSDGAKGWYKDFIEKSAIDPLKEGDTMYIMRVSENKTKMQITNTDNVTSKSQTIYVDANKNVHTQSVDDGNSKPLVFEPKQKIAICDKFLFPGEAKMKYVTYKTIINVDDEMKEYLREANFKY